MASHSYPASATAADVSGPASSTDNAVARFDGATGKILQNSGVTVDDSNNVAGVAGLTASGTVAGGSVTAATVRGGTGSGGNLTLSSTSHATKGSVVLGSASAYDEANDRLGLGITAPTAPLHVRNDTDLSAANDPLIRLENRNAAAASHPHVEFRRAGAANADLANGDKVGGLDYHARFNGGTGVVAHAHVEYTGDGTTRLADYVFETSNAGAPAERLRIRYDGVVLIAGLTANRALATGASGALEASSATATELGYVNGVTSSIQTQLDAMV